MKKIILSLLLIFFPFFYVSVGAMDLNYSAKSDVAENPFVAYGYNPETRIVSGYLAAFRVTPGRTDSCKLVFRGNSNRLDVKFQEETWESASEAESGSKVFITVRNSEIFLDFKKDSLGGDCEWILPFKVGSRVIETNDKVAVTLRAPNRGDWVGVYVISAKKALFHSEPDTASIKKAYLIPGDVIYVIKEKPDWYFVQYDNQKRKTVGWIKKADTVQP